MGNPAWRVSGQYYEACNCFALARPSKSHVKASGRTWQDVTGTNHGQYAPSSWRNA